MVSHLVKLPLRAIALRVIAATALTLTGVAPAIASQTTPAPATSAVNIAAGTPSPASNEPNETQNRPNVGDDSPRSHEFGETRNLLSDEAGLIALALAAVLGAAAAILVMRARRKSSLY
ncbi:hypothetical protein GALL_436700 [mine drainage metagenome]|uniref:Uncharacterized protein n=1 Tax=mine drainage metagenome TaxID=410659 RepID=A0A1J5PT55_9ZZZZ